MKTFQTQFQTPTLTRGIREAYKGNDLLASGMERELSDKPRPRPANVTLQEQVTQLSTRERAILQLVAEGKANKVAAAELCISIKTVEKHRSKLTEKLGIDGTAGLTRYAIAAGIIQCYPIVGMNNPQRNPEIHSPSNLAELATV